MIFILPFLPLLCCCSSSMLILLLFGDKIFGADKMNYIYSAICSSYCVMLICCLIAMIGTFWIGSKAISVAGDTFVRI